MREFFKAFSLSLFFVSGIIYPGFCGVGNVDNRYYVTDNMWATDPYKNFVLIRPCLNIITEDFITTRCFSYCTAQYIAPNLIISAQHCLKSSAEYYTIERYNDTTTLGVGAIEKVLESGNHPSSFEPGDWVIFKIRDATQYDNFYSDSYFDVQVPTETTSVINAGFGWVRILTDAELNKIRSLSQDIKELDSDEYFEELNSRMVRNGMKPLEEDPRRLKASECKIVFENYGNLKRSKYFPDILGTTCDSWEGNSGGGYISKDGKYLYGVSSYGMAGYYGFTDRDRDYMTSAKQFFDAAQKYKSQYSINKSNSAYEPIKIEPKAARMSGPTADDMKSTISKVNLPSIAVNQRGTLSTEPSVPGQVVTGVNVSNNALQWNPVEIPASTAKTPGKSNYVTVGSKPGDAGGNASTEPNITGTEMTGVAANSSLYRWDPDNIPATTTTTPEKPNYVTVGSNPGEGVGILSTGMNIAGTVMTGVAVDSSLYQWNPDVSGTISGTANAISQTTSGTQGGGNAAELQQDLKNSQEEINKLQSTVSSNIPNVSKMSNEELLRFLDGMVALKAKKQDLEILKQLQQRYESAKAKEQSKANRLLTAATVAATGIGGMELAQGLAEQKADKNAERSMDAYIATMRCKYGDSQVKAGTTEIELPGGNDSTLMKYRTEYFSLAADLKERKSALGLKPGIESEEILDKSQMGIYGNENIGITDGAYSSLYRAKMLDSEKDKQEIEAAKETSQKRVIGGGTAAGVGVVGGIVGDRLINGK